MRLTHYWSRFFFCNDAPCALSLAPDTLFWRLVRYTFFYPHTDAVSCYFFLRSRFALFGVGVHWLNIRASCGFNIRYRRRLNSHILTPAQPILHRQENGNQEDSAQQHPEASCPAFKPRFAPSIFPFAISCGSQFPTLSRRVQQDGRIVLIGMFGSFHGLDKGRGAVLQGRILRFPENLRDLLIAERHQSIARQQQPIPLPNGNRLRGHVNQMYIITHDRRAQRMPTWIPSRFLFGHTPRCHEIRKKRSHGVICIQHDSIAPRGTTTMESPPR